MFAWTRTLPAEASTSEASIRACTVEPSSLLANETAIDKVMAKPPLAATLSEAATTVESISEESLAVTETPAPESTLLPPAIVAATVLVSEFETLAPVPAPDSENDPLADTEAAAAIPVA